MPEALEKRPAPQLVGAAEPGADLKVPGGTAEQLPPSAPVNPALHTHCSSWPDACGEKLSV